MTITSVGLTKPQAEQEIVLAPGHSVADLIRAVAACLDDGKAEDVAIVDLRGKTSVADAMIVATGRSNTHVSALATRLIKLCKQADVALRTEGIDHGDWVLLDLNDVIVHLFRPEVRQFYNLEKMWSGARPSDRDAV